MKFNSSVYFNASTSVLSFNIIVALPDDGRNYRSKHVVMNVLIKGIYNLVTVHHERKVEREYTIIYGVVLIGNSNQKHCIRIWIVFQKRNFQLILVLTFWRRNYFFFKFSTPCI